MSGVRHGLRILVVGGVPARLHQGPVHWGGQVFEVTPLKFSRFADFTTSARDEVTVDVAAVDAFVDAVRGFDVVICESPEALVLAQEWRRRREAPRGIVSFDIHELLRVRALVRWYRQRRGEDPWPSTRDAPWIAWAVSSTHHVATLREAGVAARRIHLVKSSTGALSMLVPDAEARLDGEPGVDGAAAVGIPRGGVALAGTGRRDHTTGLQAAALVPDVPFVVVTEHAERRRSELAARGLDRLPNVTWLAPLPLEAFIALIGLARAVAVPLEPGGGAGGQITVGLAHRLGVPIVASSVPGITEYVEHGRTALLVPAGDPPALAAAIREVLDGGPRVTHIVDEGRVVERARCDAFWGSMWAAIRAAADEALGAPASS